MARFLVVGATGKTGQPLVKQLLEQGHSVRVIVRSPEKLDEEVIGHPGISVTREEILAIPQEELVELVRGCEGVVSCLGHVLSMRGVFGKPRDLCTAAIKRLCAAVVEVRREVPVRVVLMNTVAVGNPDESERRSLFERVFLTLLRWFLPPHLDNERAAAYLHSEVGTEDEGLEWCIVRPDSLTEWEESVYEVSPSPETGIFSGRPTARANVARFLSSLLLQDALWAKWKFRMPVVMNTAGELTQGG